MPAAATARTAAVPELASALRIAVMRLSRRLRSTRSDSNLSLTQLSVLATLDQHGGITPGELAQHEKVQPPSMTRVLCGLEQRGLVRRTAHPTDGRQSLISLDPAGQDLLREDRRRRDLWLDRRLRDLGTEELATLRAAAVILDRLARQ